MTRITKTSSLPQPGFYTLPTSPTESMGRVVSTKYSLTHNLPDPGSPFFFKKSPNLVHYCVWCG